MVVSDIAVDIKPFFSTGRIDDDYNQTLSQARSESIKDALVSLGISESRIETKGLGESSPVADNNTIEGRRANRRSEIIFVAE